MATKIRSTNIQSGTLDSDVLVEGIGVPGRISILDSIDDLPIGVISNGSMALAKGNTDALFIHNSSKGWFQLAKLNESPTPITGLDSSYEIPTNIDSALTLTLNSTDPEGIPLIWNYQTTGDASVARISNKKNVFTVRKSPRGGISSFTTTFSASDGVNVVTASSQFTLAPEIEYLIVGGGGGGGGITNAAGGGGGAGGLLTGTAKLATGSYTVTVGTGGGESENGEDSTFNNKVAVGGGTGGVFTAYNVVSAGAAGGSGGGGASGYNTGSRGGGAGVSGQGNNGGTAVQFNSSSYTSAGGGGAGGAGVTSTNTKAGDGGPGYQWLDGNYYAAGGGGGLTDESSGDQPGVGGSGIGGNGFWNKAPGGARLPGAGAANTGSGGGGGGGAGADGVVIIRYPTGAFGLVPVTGGTITQSGGYTYHTFTSDGTFTIG